MTARNLPASSRSRPLRLADHGRLVLYAAWLEAKARRGPNGVISSAFAREMACALRQLTHAERAA